MTFSQFELDAFRVAGDLNTCNIDDAAAVLRQEMYYSPLSFNSFLYEVNRLSSPARCADILHDNAGNVIVKNRYNGNFTVAGKPGGLGLPPTLPPIDLGSGYGNGGGLGSGYGGRFGG